MNFLICWVCTLHVYQIINSALKFENKSQLSRMAEAYGRGIYNLQGN